MLRKVRESKGVKIRDLAESSGINRSHISMMERGKATISVKAAVSFMDAIDLPARFIGLVLVDALAKADSGHRWIIRAERKKKVAQSD